MKAAEVFLLLSVPQSPAAACAADIDEVGGVSGTPECCVYCKSNGENSGRNIVATENFVLPANFSFTPTGVRIIAFYTEKYGIDPEQFAVLFDGATFEYFTKQIKVSVSIYDNATYDFEFTKPQWLGSPGIRNAEDMCPGLRRHVPGPE